VELAFVGASVKSVLSESSEYFSDVGLVFVEVIGIYQDIVEVDDDGDIQHVREDVIHEVLEGGGGVG